MSRRLDKLGKWRVLIIAALTCFSLALLASIYGVLIFMYYYFPSYPGLPVELEAVVYGGTLRHPSGVAVFCSKIEVFTALVLVFMGFIVYTITWLIVRGGLVEVLGGSYTGVYDKILLSIYVIGLVITAVNGVLGGPVGIFYYPVHSIMNAVMEVGFKRLLLCNGIVVSGAFLLLIPLQSASAILFSGLLYNVYKVKGDQLFKYLTVVFAITGILYFLFPFSIVAMPFARIIWFSLTISPLIGALLWLVMGIAFIKACNKAIARPRQQ
jgi:hypothetical protein